MIDIHNVTWTYPHAAEPALRRLDLHVERGELVVLCGASGSGKSTALRLVNGLVPHFHEAGMLSGTVSVDGLVTTEVELDEIGERTGTVLQHPRKQFFTDTVVEELAFAMENFGVERDLMRSRVEQALNELAAHLSVDRSLRHLSGGQQQQVAIAAAVAHHPSVVVLDEPSSNLSSDAVVRLQAELRRLKEDGFTVVVAEHRLRYLQDLVDRVVVLRDGVVHAEWEGREFRQIPDAALAREGLRGDIQPAGLLPLPGAGASVQAAVAADEVPAGALELHDVRCRAGGRTILQIDRLAFPAGEVTALRGSNGAGKTTLCQVVTGLRRASGTVLHDGVALSRRDRQRTSALVMQDVQRQLFTETVAAEIALARLGSGGEADIDNLLAALDLSQLTARHPLSLSGGQQQRVVIAGAHAARRPVVVFDEPSSGVDRRHLRSISDEIRTLAQEGAVVLLVSHDEDLLALAADRQVTLTQTSPT